MRSGIERIRKETELLIQPSNLCHNETVTVFIPLFSRTNDAQTD
jgi:hypothetical protein